MNTLSTTNFSVLTFMNIDILIALINLFSVGLLMVTVMELVCNSDIGLFASNMPL